LTRLWIGKALQSGITSRYAQVVYCRSNTHDLRQNRARALAEDHLDPSLTYSKQESKNLDIVREKVSYSRFMILGFDAIFRSSPRNFLI